MKNLLYSIGFLIVLSGLFVVVNLLDFKAWLIRKPRKGIPVGIPTLRTIYPTKTDIEIWYDDLRKNFK